MKFTALIFGKLLLAVSVLSIGGCLSSKNVTITDVDGMQLVDVGGATLEYYGDYEFGERPANWLKVVQFVTSDKRKPRKEYHSSATTFIEPWNNCVILKLPREGELDIVTALAYFDEPRLQTIDFQQVDNEAVEGRFWVNGDPLEGILSPFTFPVYFSALLFDTVEDRFCVIHWSRHEEGGESLRRESSKIFDSLRLRP